MSQGTHPSGPGPGGPPRPGLAWAIRLLRSRVEGHDMADQDVPAAEAERVELLFDLMAMVAGQAKATDYVPTPLVHDIIAHKEAQDASRSWPSPRPRRAYRQPRPPLAALSGLVQPRAALVAKEHHPRTADPNRTSPQLVGLLGLDGRPHRGATTGPWENSSRTSGRPVPQTNWPPSSASPGAWSASSRSTPRPRPEVVVPGRVKGSERVGRGSQQGERVREVSNARRPRPASAPGPVRDHPVITPGPI